MKLKSKFNTIYESIIKELIKESSEMIDGRFDFRSEPDTGELECFFTITIDAVRYNVIATCSDDPMHTMFKLSSKKGDETLTEEDFKLKYFLDYQDYMNAYRKYKGEDPIEFSKADIEEVKSFSIQLNAENGDPSDGTKKTEVVKVDDTNFAFTMLEDEAVEHYCECTFQMEDETLGEVTYYKCLLNLKEKNSVVIKIIILDEDGNVLDVVSETDLKLNEHTKDIMKKFRNAIKQMEAIVFDRDSNI